jgi:MoxR-like ATPase
LLQGMQERQVTVGQETYNLPDPFFVIATQNPIEQEGTYPLPEAQLDRFMFNIIVDYPTLDEEKRILGTTTKDEAPDLVKVLSARAIVNMQKLVATVPISEYVIKYVTKLVRATRPKDPTAPDFVKQMVDWGGGPRAGQYLIMGGKARAVLHGRYHVSTEDIQAIEAPVLRHRIITNFNADAEGVTTDTIVERLIESIPAKDGAVATDPRTRGVLQ